MATPEFLQFHCNSAENGECTTCPRDFTIPINVIEGIYKSTDGKAMILIVDTHYCPYPICGDKLRFIKTGLSYSEVVSILNGKIHDLRNMNVVYQDRITKR